MAWSHVRAVFGEIPAPNLMTLCDVDMAPTAKRAAEWGFAAPETDWRRILDDPKIDIVSITTPNNLHREMAIACLEAGKHVWCEKPMALTLADAHAMARAAASSNVKTILGYNYIRNPAIAHARRMLMDGVIGQIVHVRGAVDEDYMAAEGTPWTWRSRIATGGLGALGDITCHLVSLVHYLVGPIARLAADIETVHKTRPVPGTAEMREVENDDIAHAIVRFESGISGVLASSRCAQGRKSLIRIELHGTKGTIAFDQERMNELELYVAEGPEAQRGFRKILTGGQHPPYAQFTSAPGHQLGFNELKVIECMQFLDAIAGRDEPFGSFADGLRIERVIHGMARSARERAWVEV